MIILYSFQCFGLCLIVVMAQNKTGKAKPVVPPKPSHLTCWEKKLPKPPDQVVDVDGIEKISEEQHYDDDGYLKPFPGKISPQRSQIEIEKNEEPENVSPGLDVRQRPLPLLPGEIGENASRLPWFYSVDRRKAEDFVTKARDGSFLIRPSSKGPQSFALTLWYHNRSYHIPIRKRNDGKFALGTPKDLEQSFTSIELLIRNYQREELVLFSNGVETGRTLLFPLDR